MSKSEEFGKLALRWQAFADAAQRSADEARKMASKYAVESLKEGALELGELALGRAVNHGEQADSEAPRTVFGDVSELEDK